MPGRPDLLDNLSGETTHAAALAYLIGDIASRYPLAVATGFINLGGLHELAQIATDGRTVRSWAWRRPAAEPVRPGALVALPRA